MPKVTLANAAVNDYIKFVSVNEVFGMPCGDLAKPGDTRYFRIIKKYSPVSVAACCGTDTMYFDDHMMDSQGVHVVKAQFPLVLADWHLQVSLPAPYELPWRLRFLRAYLNLMRIPTWNTRTSLA
jgi:hypothetical protein